MLVSLNRLEGQEKQLVAVGKLKGKRVVEQNVQNVVNDVDPIDDPLLFVKLIKKVREERR